MEAESFFARWSKRNAEVAAERHAREKTPGAADVPSHAATPPPPSLDDVAQLTSESDFTPFVARGVDEHIRRSAMKKLFADPRFNVMDGLDVYIEDYHTFTPIPAAMLAALNHAQSLLDPLAQRDNPLTTPLDALPQVEACAPSLAEDRDSAAACGASLTGNASRGAPPPPEEQNSHDDPVQGM
ncbi:DUF3306 domain-containing protein [Noviherbaspirillum autotrophicum]|uniref:DUF3306 domain-containing protein n=1 Tax=Noviherbaspirillum autotrophicum TaxID=709839 RepID=UPI00069338D8|nr:DUF3306 domain-containing protein [Noviherbaspirillum autotrophicum]